jgi:tetratricopeptide (TPR) repeat protein
MSRFQNQAANEAAAIMKTKMHEYTATAEGRKQYQNDKAALEEQLQRKYVSEYFKDQVSKGLATDANKEYINAVNSYNELNNAARDTERSMNAAIRDVSNIDYDAAKEATRKFMKSDDAKEYSGASDYKAASEYVAQKDYEKSLKNYQKQNMSNPEYIKQVSVTQEAYNRSTGGGKPPAGGGGSKDGGGPKPGGDAGEHKK